MNTPATKPSRSGFTLIELSIVLVIIGLIIGGVLVGQDLIRAAEIRKVIKQVEEFKLGTADFKLKYNCLPGDCPNASTLGFTAYCSFSADGNGNELIEQHTGVEALNYSVHLRDAGMIPNSYESTCAANQKYVLGKGIIVGTSFRPESFAGATANNYLVIATHPTNNWTYNVSRPILMTGQARDIDKKLDDGLPMSGSIRASYSYYGCGVVAGNPDGAFCFNTPSKKSDLSWAYGWCVDDTVSPVVYDLSQDGRTYLDGPGACELQIKM